MEVRQMEIFRILAHELSFTRAAEKAHCVQSNVTVQIRRLEQELGVPLFERLGKQVSLTPNGERLLPYVDRILRLVDEAQTITVSGDNLTGTLRIASPESVLTYRLPPVLRVFHGRFPDVDLTFRACGTKDLLPHLERGDLDVGLVIDDVFEHPRLQVEVLCEESLSLVVHPEHPILRQQKFSAAKLARECFLLTDIGCAYRTKLEKALAQLHVLPGRIMEFSGVETIKQCAALGMGIACLPDIVVESEISSGKLAAVPWPKSDLRMCTLIVWHRDKWISPAIRTFLTLVREHFRRTES